MALRRVLRQRAQRRKGCGSNELRVVAAEVHDAIEDVLDRGVADPCQLLLKFLLCRLLMFFILVHFIVKEMARVHKVLRHQEAYCISALGLYLLLRREAAVQEGLDARLDVLD